MTIKEAKIYIRRELSDFYSENELISFIKIIFSDIFGMSSVDLILKENKTFSKEDFQKLKRIIARLKKYEPLQYITGFTEFYGLRFKVSPDVLIPRPETEELVDLVIKENRDPAGFENPQGLLRILDIGTGSGCIAVSLAKNIAKASVFAIDISTKALDIAKINASDNSVKVSFVQKDILKGVSGVEKQKYDIIVSNPPYVTISEKEKMQKNVLDYEPEQALFVKDEKPLVFYEAVARFAKQNLSEQGKLYLEINERFGSEVKELLLSFGFLSVEILKDINGKYRIVKAKHFR